MAGAKNANINFIIIKKAFLAPRGKTKKTVKGNTKKRKTKTTRKKEVGNKSRKFRSHDFETLIL